MGKKIGIIGAGQMCQAMLKGFLRNSDFPMEDIIVTNQQNTQRLEHVKIHYGVRVTTSSQMLCANSEVIIIAVKPQDFGPVMSVIKGYVTEQHLLISIVAGIKTKDIEKVLAKVPIVRVMPNTSSQVLCSLSALAQGSFADETSLSVAKELFEAIGSVVVVEEDYMDVVTALSGSGPAYVYYFVESLAEAGTKMGLTEEAAYHMALETLWGAAHMLTQSQVHARELRKRVSSPNGTTVAGLEIFESHHFKLTIFEAIAAASQRSKELGLLYATATQ